ncbi:MAG: alpha-L-fucosidase [Bacillota bacterium]|nr:alpha-L-fucosidase [Bacillota bacterium]
MIKSKLIPLKRQLDFLDWELGLFLHFGILTFFEDRKIMDMQQMPAEAFNPEQLDCDSWIRITREIGFRYAVLTAKHHDGFALWPSRFSDYTVAQTPWKSGQGDVICEFTNACRKYDMKIGLYYSPFDYSMKKKGLSDREYDDYIIGQLSELLTDYGKIDYLWFDAEGSRGHVYDGGRVIDAIRSRQPDILIFNEWDPDTRGIGNEAGLAPIGHVNTVTGEAHLAQTSIKHDIGEYRFLPADSCTPIRRKTWFYKESSETALLTIEELVGIYEQSVGRGTNLLLNISPDRRGLLPELDVTRAAEFCREIKRRFASPVSSKPIYLEGNRIHLDFDQPTMINTIVIQENLSKGESVHGFKILIKHVSFGPMINTYIGASIGHKRICLIPPVYAKGVVLEITEADGDFMIEGLAAFMINNEARENQRLAYAQTVP